MNKYRAWDKEKKEMYGVYGWNEIDKEVYMCSVPESKFRDGSMHTWHQVIKPLEKVILMQYTGLVDKNGVYYWQDDLVKYKNKIYRLVLGTYAFELVGFYESYQDNPYDFFSEKANLLGEIIGNIHQNPELLK